jgi:tetratricopeptide (TPR) repeat protein
MIGMKLHGIATLFGVLLAWTVFHAIPAACLTDARVNSQDLTEFLTARDRGDVGSLNAAIREAGKQAASRGDYRSYLRLALVSKWMCEAADDRGDGKAVKEAAQSGINAAEHAVRLNPESSDAHWLLGDLLGQMIPHVAGGGIRYGSRSTRELDKALQLDPKNSEAMISRAIAYFLTPHAFGGSREKAIALLEKVAAPDNTTDAACAAHVWLARVYADRGALQKAQEEAKEAEHLNPQRLFAQRVYNEVATLNGVAH